MQTVTRDVRNRKGALIATIEVEQAESIAEITTIAGSEEEALTIFNRAWIIHSMNEHLPGKKSTGVRRLVQSFKSLSPEVQAALKGKTPEEIVALFNKAVQ